MFVNDNSSAEYETCRRTPIQTFADRENGVGREISVVCHNLSHCSYFMFFFHFSSVGAYPIQFSEIGLSFSNPVRLCLPVLYFAKNFSWDHGFWSSVWLCKFSSDLWYKLLSPDWLLLCKKNNYIARNNGRSSCYHVFFRIAVQRKIFILLRKYSHQNSKICKLLKNTRKFAQSK